MNSFKCFTQFLNPNTWPWLRQLGPEIRPGEFRRDGGAFEYSKGALEYYSDALKSVLNLLKTMLYLGYGVIQPTGDVGC
jgi:hypothetical protein